MTSAPSRSSWLRARLASSTRRTASPRFSRASASVAPCVFAPGSSSPPQRNPPAPVETPRSIPSAFFHRSVGPPAVRRICSRCPDGLAAACKNLQAVPNHGPFASNSRPRDMTAGPILRGSAACRHRRGSSSKPASSDCKRSVLCSFLCSLGWRSGGTDGDIRGLGTECGPDTRAGFLSDFVRFAREVGVGNGVRTPDFRSHSPALYH
jgi:hypothetical protein